MFIYDKTLTFLPDLLWNWWSFENTINSYLLIISILLLCSVFSDTVVLIPVLQVCILWFSLKASCCMVAEWVSEHPVDAHFLEKKFGILILSS